MIVLAVPILCGMLVGIRAFIGDCSLKFREEVSGERRGCETAGDPVQVDRERRPRVASR